MRIAQRTLVPDLLRQRQRLRSVPLRTIGCAADEIETDPGKGIGASRVIGRLPKIASISALASDPMRFSISPRLPMMMAF